MISSSEKFYYFLTQYQNRNNQTNPYERYLNQSHTMQSCFFSQSCIALHISVIVGCQQNYYHRQMDEPCPVAMQHIPERQVCDKVDKKAYGEEQHEQGGLRTAVVPSDEEAQNDSQTDCQPNVQPTHEVILEVVFELAVALTRKEL